ncbi:FecR family protein [Aestuariivivens sediminicola]|uniref:FecR family protein n=1 Tax=Aestuariivivens sediminicola TaxID=2913560 RepID=UPI001F58875C
MKIKEIILKKLRNKLSKEEESIFQNWIKKSNENLMLYELLLQLKNEGQDAHEILELDIEAAWEMVKKKIRSKHKIKPIPFYKRKIIRYAAAVLILILINGYLFRLNIINKSNDTTVDDYPIINTEIIQTGSSKAILTLHDGTNIPIGKDISFQNEDARNVGELLVYNKENPNKNSVEYNYLTVPRGGQYQLDLSDGTKVWLNSESQIKYPVVFEATKSRKVELIYGEAYFEVSPSSQNNGVKFIVHNQNQDIEVLGTKFNLKAYKDETTIHTTLVEGVVMVKVNDNQQKLIPNQQSILDKDNNNIAIKTVDVYNEISWKDGVFVFDSKSLQEIMKVMSRWYDMEVIFMNDEVKDEQFIGVLRKNRDIETVLSSVKNFGTITDYTISGKNVILK